MNPWRDIPTACKVPLLLGRRDAVLLGSGIDPEVMVPASLQVSEFPSPVGEE